MHYAIILIIVALGGVAAGVLVTLAVIGDLDDLVDADVDYVDFEGIEADRELADAA